METKQTAVDWIFNQLYLNDRARYNDIIEKAKQMEKEQIMDAHIYGDNQGCSKEWGYDTFGPEQYYNETYGK